MDYLDIRKAHLLGWSDGGIIGLDMAINHPERLLRVIAYGANYNPSGSVRISKATRSSRSIWRRQRRTTRRCRQTLHAGKLFRRISVKCGLPSRISPRAVAEDHGADAHS
jgi:pimeloyl-ACP methyl ester carboxylesterase